MEIGWIIGEFGYLTGQNGEVGCLHYGCGIKDKKGFPIDLYTFQQWGSGSDQRECSSCLSNSSPDPLWSGFMPQTETTLEVDRWYQSHPGKGMCVHSSKSRYPSRYEAAYFSLSKTIVCTDIMDEYTRASFAIMLVLIDDPCSKRVYWHKH